MARSLGLPLSTIVSRKLEEFVDSERVVFEKPLIPNAKTRKIIEQADKDLKEGNIGPTYKSIDEFIVALSEKN